MEEPYTIRAATPDDLPAIVEFNQSMAEETEGKRLSPETLTAGVAAVLGDPRHGFYLIAEREHQAAGCLMITYEWSDWRNGLFWWVQSVYVRPAHRRSGVYRRLYREVRERARAAGDVRGFRLYVEKENLRAQQTYEALGMQETHYKMYEELL